MDRNALLAATRAEFLQGFLDAAGNAIGVAAREAFRKADYSFSAVEQRALLDSHRILTEKQIVIRAQFSRVMDQLLTRSFQTTYSTFRPSFLADFSGNTLTLLDTSQFEDQLRIDDITARFRNAGDQQLRDLNIRIALLFEQDTIKERENPFRPWLFTRAIASGVEALGERAELVPILSDLIAEAMEESIAVIYNRINAHLAENGIAAQLQLKVQRSHGAGAPLAGGRADSAERSDASEGGTAQAAAPLGDSMPVDHGNPGNHEFSSDIPTARVDQLMEIVRRMAAGSNRAGGLPSQPAAGQRGTPAATTIGDFPPLPSIDEILPSRAPRGRSASAGGAGGARGAGSAGGWLARSQAVGDVLRKLFTGDPHSMRYDRSASGDASTGARTSEAGPGSAGGYRGPGTLRAISAPLADSLLTMMREQTPDGTAMFDDTQAVRNLILEQRDALSESTRDVNEQMTIDVVAMLFEFILRDAQIPAEVRAQLGRLQFLVLKVALRESSLLTQKGHPARMLVNRIGAISVGLQQLDPSGARISGEIIRIVETLLASDTESSTPFSTMLDEFDSFIAHELRKGDDKVDHAVQVIESAQGRTLRFTHLSGSLEEALKGLSIDPFLRAFLSTSWVHVIERSERDADLSALRFRSLIPDLLWSILPRADQESRLQLFALLPIIVRTIREGLDLIEWDATRQQPVLDWLVEAHRTALRGGADVPGGATLASLHEHFADFVKDANPADGDTAALQPKASDRWLFIDEAIRASDGSIELLDPIAAAEQAEDGVDGADGSTGMPETDTPLADSILDQLRAGVAVELNLGGVPGMARLSWIDEGNSTLVLRIEGHATLSVISARMFQRMLRSGRLKFVESAPVFERAVESVLRSAEVMQQAA